MLKYAVLIVWRKKGASANFYAFCISGKECFAERFSPLTGGHDTTAHWPANPLTPVQAQDTAFALTGQSVTLC